MVDGQKCRQGTQQDNHKLAHDHGHLADEPDHGHSDGVSEDQEKSLFGAFAEIMSENGRLNVGVFVDKSHTSFETDQATLKAAGHGVGYLTCWSSLLDFLLYISDDSANHLDDGDN
mmetsp:Transcript_49423/g.96633  ORF Transcript_49423/g.96633 Transcript_49423/m.96633 type:complete len:116 (+) Transcript_49423:596-943(+)